MEYNFDLFKVLIIATIVCLIIAAIGTMEFNFNTKEIAEALEKPLELKNWHYALLIWVIYISGNKSNH